MIRNLDTGENTEINLVFEGEKESFSIPIDVYSRTTITTHFNDGFDYEYSGLKGNITLDSLPSDTYTLGIEVKNQGQVGYKKTTHYVEIDHGDDSTPVTNLDFVAHQNIISEKIIRDFEAGDSTLSSPFTIVNPYGVSPLSAISLFQTEKPAQITVQVEGLKGGETLENTYTNFQTYHQIPIYGLYANKETTVTLTATYEDGTSETKTIKLTGEALPEDFVVMTVDQADSTQMAEGLTFYMRQSRDTYLNALDSNGDVRFMFSTKSIGMATGLTC